MLNHSSIKRALGLGVRHAFLQSKLRQVLTTDGPANVPMRAGALPAYDFKHTIRKKML